MSRGATDLVQVDVSARMPRLFSHFVVPLYRGEAVSVESPLNRLHLDDALASVSTGDGLAHQIAFELQAMARHLLNHELEITIGLDEVRLAAAAYQICWFFHGAVEDGRVWKRRMDNISSEVEELLDTVEPILTEEVLVARHLMFRNLVRLERTDSKVEFGRWWGALNFKGQEPRWTRFPGRGKGFVSRTRVQVSRSVKDRAVGDSFSKLMGHTPLTALIESVEIGGHFDFGSAIAPLALTATCRLVTNRILERGLGEYIGTLGVSFLDHLRSDAPVAHKRYLARFLYNLLLTHCAFEVDGESLMAPLDGAVHRAAMRGGGGAFTSPWWEETLAGRGEGYDSAAAGGLGVKAGTVERVTLEISQILFVTLHMLRGPLGGAHLLSDEALALRVERFLSRMVERERMVVSEVKAATNVVYRELVQRLEYE